MLSFHWQCSPQYRSENSDRETDVNRPVHRNDEEKGHYYNMRYEPYFIK